MGTYIPSREDAYKLLNAYVDDESLIKHSLMVEASMRYFAQLYGEDQERWGVIGLIHDLDFQKYPERHCIETERILRENQWPEEYIRNVMSHAWKSRTDVEPKEIMEKIIYTVDELTGLIYATAIMRPSKSLEDLTVKSVKKKWKQKSFAASIKREVIEEGIEILGSDKDTIIAHTIEALKPISKDLGLS